MHYQRITPPATDFITVAEAADNVYADADYDAVKLQRYIKAAIGMAEEWCERAFINQEWQLTLSRFPSTSPYNRLGAIFLPRGKCQSVISLTYVNANGETKTMDPNSYTVNTTGDCGRILQKAGSSWPGTDGQNDEAVTVKYIVGYGTELPEDKSDIKSACLLLVGDLYEIRQNRTAAINISDSKFYQQFLNPYKIYHDFNLYNQ